MITLPATLAQSREREREREYIVWVQQSVGTLDASFNRIPIQTEAQSQQMCLSNSCFELISLWWLNVSS